MSFADLSARFEQDPELLAKARAEFAKVASTPFKPISLKSALMMGAGVGLASFATGVAASELGGGYQKLKGAIFKKRNFNQMMEANPDLKQLDKKQVGMAFNTLVRFNPEFASDPLVAGTWTRNTAGYGEGVPYDAAARLVDASSKIQQTKSTVGRGDATAVTTALDIARNDRDMANRQAFDREIQTRREGFDVKQTARSEEFKRQEQAQSAKDRARAKLREHKAIREATARPAYGASKAEWDRYDTYKDLKTRP